MTDRHATALADVNFAHGKLYGKLHKWRLDMTPAEMAAFATEVEALAHAFRSLARRLEEGI